MRKTTLVTLALLLLTVSAFAAKEKRLKKYDCPNGLLEEVVDDGYTKSGIYYQVWGGKNPDNPKPKTIVMVAGIGGTHASYLSLAIRLADRYRVVLYDQRQHGFSVHEGEDFSSATMADDLRDLLDHLNIKDAHVLGHSMGGRTVLRFAQRYPTRCLSVAVEDMHAMGRKTRLPVSAELKAFFAKELAGPYETPEAAFAAALKLYRPEEAGLVVKRFLSYRSEDGNFGFKFYFDPMFAYWYDALQEDLTDALRGVRAPLLFFAADFNPVLHGKGIEHIRANTTGAVVRIVPGSGHGVYSSQRRQYLQIYTDFLLGKPIESND